MSWQRAALVGLIIGVLTDIIAVLSLGIVGALLVFAIWLAGFFAIGAYAARQTGRIRSGTLSGLVAGLASGIAFFIFGVILINTLLNGASQPFGAAQMAVAQADMDDVKELITQIWGIYAVLQFGLGIGLGALGGLLGKITVRGPR